MGLFRKCRSPRDETPDIFVCTSNGGFVTMTGPHARRLGDAIKAVIQGNAVIVPIGTGYIHEPLWSPEK